MASRIALNLGTVDGSLYKVDVAESVYVETKRIPVDVSRMKLSVKNYRVVIIKNVSNTNVYVSSDNVNYITLEPGATVGIGLEVIELSNDLYVWADAPGVIEVLMIR